MAFARWSKSSTSTCIFWGAVQLFSFFSTTFSFSFGDLVDAFLSGEGCFFGGDFSFFFVFGQGEGYFYQKVNLFSFSPGGEGHPC